MKRILFVIPSLAVGGLERVQVNIANALANRGHEITIITLDADHTLAVDLDKSIKILHKPYRPNIMKKIPYIRHKFYDDGMWETRASSKRLHRYYVGKEKYDVEIAFFRGLPVKIVSGAHTDFEPKSLCTKKSAGQHNDFKKKSGCVKTLAWVHTDFEKAVGYKNNFKSMSQVYNAYQSFDKVVCVSNQAQEGFKKIIGDTGNLTTIYNLLPIKEIQALSSEKFYLNKTHKLNVVMVGRLLDSAKGQLRLISAVKSLHDEGVDVGLTLVGGGPDENNIREKINECNAKDYVYMVGMQNNPYPYIKQADLLVCSSYFEGYNLTVAEALILGTPVMSTDCTGPNEILDAGRYGLIVQNSEQGIVDGLRELYNNRQLLDYYRKKAIERIDFFNEDKIIKQIQSLWEE